MARGKAVLAVLQALIIVVSAATVGVGASVPTHGDTVGSTSVEDIEYSAQDDVVAEVNRSLTNDTSSKKVVVVRLEEARIPADASPQEVKNLLQGQAEKTQSQVVDFAKKNTGYTIDRRFWISNAILIEVGPKADLTRLTKIDAVKSVHENFEVSLPPEPEQSSDVSTNGVNASQTDINTTYGPDQVNATKVWNQYGTMGEGAAVAVLDTGVDGDHPAIEDSLQKFAEFDETGEITTSGVDQAYDTNGHGTHTSGIVVGDNSNGEYIGTAPNATLYHGLVLDGGTGTFAQVLGGMQWAVKNDADVISMSLGAPGYHDEYIDPVRNAEAAGTVVVASVGNGGPGTSGSPGNVYETLAVGATDSQGDVASFSSGEVVNASNWSSPPASWPNNYIVPDVVAPGVSVLSSVPDDDYSRISGTSMSAPAVSGVTALLVSAADNNPSVNLLKESVKSTAKAPDSSDPTRYGHGIVDALAAMDQVVTDENVSIRVESLSSPHVTPGENFTASLRVSNLDSVNVTLNSTYSNHRLSSTENVSVYINGSTSKTGLPADINVSPTASTDHFTVSVAVDEELASPVFDITFENESSGSSFKATQKLKVHEDPLIIENTTNETQINQTLSFVSPGTTVAFENGTYSFNHTIHIGPETTVTSNASAEVEFDTQADTGVVIADGGALYDVTVRGDYSNPTDVGIYAQGNLTTVENVDVFETAFGVVVAGDGTRIGNASIPVSSAGDVVDPIGIAVLSASNSQIADSSIAATGQNATGISVKGSSATTIDQVSVVTSAPEGVMAQADAVEIIGSSETSVSGSSFTSDAGSAIRTLGSSDTTVVGSTLEGSNVSAGVTGTLFVEATGYSSFDTLDTLLDAAATKQTIGVGEASKTTYNLRHLSADEYRALASVTNDTRIANLSEQFPDISLESVRSMNRTERLAYANETFSNLTKEDIEALSTAAQDVDAYSHDAFKLQDSSVTGEFVPVIAFDGDLMMVNSTVTNSSYSKWGVASISSNLYIANSHVNPTDGNVSYETGVLNEFSYLFVENSTISATTGIANYLGDAYLANSQIEAKFGMVGLGYSGSYASTFNTTEVGIADAWVAPFGTDFNSPTGVVAEDGYLHYNDFSDTNHSYEIFDNYFSSAEMNWFGDARGPTTPIEQTSGAAVSGADYDPFLTKPLSEIEIPAYFEESNQEGTQAFATDLEMDTGQAYAFAVPGPTQGNLSQVFNSFDGVIYAFDAESQTWTLITPGNDEQLHALDALLIVPESPARAVIDFEDSDDNTKVPASADLQEGWNFVGAPQYGEADDAFAASSANPARIINVYNGPESQIGWSEDYWTVYTFESSEYPPQVSPFQGYFVYAEQNGTLASNLPAGVTASEMMDALAVLDRERIR